MINIKLFWSHFKIESGRRLATIWYVAMCVNSCTEFEDSNWNVDRTYNLLQKFSYTKVWKIYHQKKNHKKKLLHHLWQQIHHFPEALIHILPLLSSGAKFTFLRLLFIRWCFFGTYPKWDFIPVEYSRPGYSHCVSKERQQQQSCYLTLARTTLKEHSGGLVRSPGSMRS